MTSFVKFTPLSGAHDESPLCYLLEIDEAKLLLDCGWSESLDVGQLAALAKVARQVDAVLLSHADMDHMGALPYAAVHLGLACPVYATTPVHDMGLTFLQDLVQARLDQEDFGLFSLADVETAFRSVTNLRYSQPLGLAGKCQGITITAFNGGHTLGGTIWKIKKDSEEIVYAVDYNHRKERHLNGAVLGRPDSTLSRPSLLITDALNILEPDPLPRQKRDVALIDSITGVLKNQGNVLIPTDSSTRVLELLYMLDQHWSYSRLGSHLVFLTHRAQNTINLAKSMTEWMGQVISQAMGAREHAFEFKSVRIAQSLKDLESLAGPKVVMTSFPGMTMGHAHELLNAWGSDARNMVILPDRAQPGTWSRMLYDEWVALAADTSGAAGAAG
ncbi:beta-lactamase-like protein, partial [Entophlyctis helioformis]